MQAANSRRPRSSRSTAENASVSARSSAIVLVGLAGAERAALRLALLLVVDQLLVERQALVMERVPEALALGAQVLLVVGIGNRLDRDLVADREAVALEAVDLLRVVGEDPDTGEPQVDQNLGADPVVAQVRR